VVDYLGATMLDVLIIRLRLFLIGRTAIANASGLDGHVRGN
jgi:hypothetical protein